MRSMYEQYLSQLKVSFNNLKSNKEKVELLLTEDYKFNNGDYTAEGAQIVKKWIENEIRKIELLNKFDKQKIVNPQKETTSNKSKTDLLSENLSKYGFFELEKVIRLSNQGKESLIEKISEKGLPYAIAMFDYLQFIPFLEKHYFDAKYKLHIEVSKWFGSDKEGRTVKGNISSLLNYSTENRNRYTAYLHKENVRKYYEQLI